MSESRNKSEETKVVELDARTYEEFRKVARALNIPEYDDVRTAIGMFTTVFSEYAKVRKANPDCDVDIKYTLKPKEPVDNGGIPLTSLIKVY